MITPNGYLNADHIQPPHEVMDPEKFDRLVAEFEANGWNGRPLLVVQECDTDGNDLESYTALTGSHRIAAGREAELREVPCYIISGAALLELELTTDDFSDDDLNLSYLRDLGDADAVALMQAEIDANNAEAA